MQIIHTKYYKLRKKILGIFLLILLISFPLFKFLVPDYFIKESDLKTESGIIKYSFMNKYREWERYRGYIYKNCLDVVLTDKPYYIRFTDELDEKYWAIIKDSNNYTKPIQVKFQTRLLHNGVLYNPNEVLIGNKLIIPYDSKKNFTGCAIIFFFIIIVLCIYYFLKLWKQYKKDLYQDDKQVGQESIWKLISIWLND